MATANHFRNIDKASQEDLSKKAAEKLIDPLRDLISALEQLVETLGDYADSDRESTADAREALAGDAGTVMDELRSLRVPLADDQDDD